MANNKARKASSARGGASLTRYAYRVLREAGINYKISHRNRTTILGQGRPPKPVFPRARYKILRKLTY